jgi:hypothetical protein
MGKIFLSFRRRDSLYVSALELFTIKGQTQGLPLQRFKYLYLSPEVFNGILKISLPLNSLTRNRVGCFERLIWPLFTNIEAGYYSLSITPEFVRIIWF